MVTFLLQSMDAAAGGVTSHRKWTFASGKVERCLVSAAAVSISVSVSDLQVSDAWDLRLFTAAAACLFVYSVDQEQVRRNHYYYLSL